MSHLKINLFSVYSVSQNLLHRQKKKTRLKRVISGPRLENISSHQSWRIAINSRALNYL